MVTIDIDKFIDPVLWYTVFLFSIVIHEAAHSWTAYKMGDDTAYNAGQVTLNPIPHIKREPFGTVIVPFLTYSLSGWMLGWASAPVSGGWSYSKPKKAALMSLAGPSGNLLLVIIAAGMIHLGINLNYFLMPDSISFSSIAASNGNEYLVIAARFVSIMFSLNLILLVFNLIPIPPLDGSGVVPLFLPDTIGRKYLGLLNRQSLSFIGILIAWQVMGYIYSDIFSAAIHLLYSM